MGRELPVVGNVLGVVTELLALLSATVFPLLPLDGDEYFGLELLADEPPLLDGDEYFGLELLADDPPPLDGDEYFGLELLADDPPLLDGDEYFGVLDDPPPLVYFGLELLDDDPKLLLRLLDEPKLLREPLLLLRLRCPNPLSTQTNVAKTRARATTITLRHMVELLHAETNGNLRAISLRTPDPSVNTSFGSKDPAAKYKGVWFPQQHCCTRNAYNVLDVSLQDIFRVIISNRNI